jgi:hypothetical protein
MKKTFPLQAAGKDDARVRDKIRHEINKYVRRCRRKEPPEGFAQWDFACKIGPSAPQSEARSLKELAGIIDAVAGTGATEVYVQIDAVPAQRRSAGMDEA